MEISSTPRRKFEFNLEALRGFAAILVVFHHSIYFQFGLDPGYSADSKWINDLPGHTSVLLFFILSGYVIGLTNTNRLTNGTIIPYVRKRLVRLYPIYLISLIFTLLIARNHYGSGVFIGHLLFLQNSVVPVMNENSSLWSLNNEVLYYIAFIPISYLSLSPGRICLVALGLGIFCNLALHQPLLSSWSIGFAFWCSGLWLAQTTHFKRQPSSALSLIALLFLFLGYESLNPLVTGLLVICEKLHLTIVRQEGPSVLLKDIVQLPFILYLFLRFTNHTIKYSTLFSLLVIASCFFYYYHIVTKYGFSSSQGANLLMPILFLSTGAVLLLFSYSQPLPSNPVVLPEIFLKLGAISYGIYVIHLPISFMLSHVTFFSGSALTFIIRLIIDMLLVLGFGYILELRIQPWFKKNLDSLLRGSVSN